MRLFIAISLPDAQKQGLADIQRRLRRGTPPVRWVKPDRIHLTLKFMGYMKESDLPAVKEIMGRCADECRPFTVRLHGVGAFPNAKNPRVIWVGVRETGGMLQELAGKLDKELARLGVETESRPYSPHLTLGRVKEKIRESSFPEILSGFSEEDAGEFHAGDIKLIRSDLRPDGPIYTVLHSAGLGR